MDPNLRDRLDRMYRAGAIAGAIILAACLGLILGGEHSPDLIALVVGLALFVGGQIWARGRN